MSPVTRPPAGPTARKLAAVMAVIGPTLAVLAAVNDRDRLHGVGFVGFNLLLAYVLATIARTGYWPRRV
ncbi:hypothetical protein [Paludisphaera rhizosphaerae]|uniref:hypothetical protein n=1 Tax=Paludisphaera rhizosphaerae TaxID=2711216 RepID=UPI0013EA7B57|nr:hypothetical protein [Paludisphaera rhizosphaerae]